MASNVENASLPGTFYSITLLDFSLIVKAATLIFISGRGSAFYLIRKGNQVLFIIW